MASPSRHMARTLVRQDGIVLTPVMSTATLTSHTPQAYAGLLAAQGFGVGRSFAVLVVVFAAMFALMLLGGFLRAAWHQRSKKQP